MQDNVLSPAVPVQVDVRRDRSRQRARHEHRGVLAVRLHHHVEQGHRAVSQSDTLGVSGRVSFMRHLKEYADCINTKYAVEMC